MANKPFYNRSFLDIYKSTRLGYPPKDKQVFWANSFVEGEHFHKSNFGPLQDGFGANTDVCAGRVLRPLSQVEWECGNNRPTDGEIKEFQTSVSGAVGSVTYSMDPFFSEVNEEGDLASIDPVTGLITLEEGVCQGSYPPWIIYRVCDSCGCSEGTIWLQDCSGDCCTVPCDPLPEVAGEEEPGINTTEQYTLTDAQGSVLWEISGTDVSIDSSGLATFGSSSCGTATVTATDSCCEDFTKEVRVQGNGSSWIESTICEDSTPTPTSVCEVIVGGVKDEYLYDCFGDPCSDFSGGCFPLEAPCTDTGVDILSGLPTFESICETGYPCVYVHTRSLWSCPP